jgi:hypothetical protein
MQYDDPFATNDEDGYQEIPHMHESYSVSSYQSTVNSKKKKLKQLTDMMKNQDKGYRKYVINMNLKKNDIDAYSTSMTPGTKIRDAITGARDARYKVGSADEDLFFKVRMGIGHVGFVDDPDKTETTLFYDNPEQFERHMHTTVSQQIKENWRTKYMNQLAKYQDKD